MPWTRITQLGGVSDWNLWFAFLVRTCAQACLQHLYLNRRTALPTIHLPVQAIPMMSTDKRCMSLPETCNEFNNLIFAWPTVLYPLCRAALTEELELSFC